MTDAPSTLFNADWYLAQYPDVAAAVAQGRMTAEEHFQLYGNTEGRAPGPLFNPQDYLAANPDVAEAVAAGLLTAYDHFTQFGAGEGRSPLALFDVDFYLAQNPDVAAAVEAGLMSAVEHFLTYGQYEPRQITPLIDLGAYTSANPDIADAARQAGFSPLAHLLSYGAAENRDLGNGISLGLFAHDPAFQNAIASGDFQQALARVEGIAPFLPHFQPPAGWEAPADTPIPTDFTPPENTQLVIPPSVIVPPDTELPGTFQPVTPPAPTPPMPPVPSPPGPPMPGPTPGGGDGAGSDVAFNATTSNGVVSFSGPATGDISMNIGGNGLVSFTRDGITAQTALNLNNWAAGHDFIKLQAGQTLVLSPAQATLLADALNCGRSDPSSAIIGTGAVRIDTDRISNQTGGVDLLAISPEVALSFTGGPGITVADKVTLFIHPEHAHGIPIAGEGSAWVAGGNDLPLSAAQNANALFNGGMAQWMAEHGSARGPATLDINTNGTSNLLLATGNDDHIAAGGDAWNIVFPGKGKDTVELNGTSGHIVVIETGVLQQYVGEVGFDVRLSEEGHGIFLYLGHTDPNTPGEALLTEYRNGKWGDFRDVTHSGLTNYSAGKPVSGVSLDTETGVVTLVRDLPFSVYAAEQSNPNGNGAGTIKKPDLSGAPPLAADSHFWAMDEIHGFSPGTDTIFSRHLYHGGYGNSTTPLGDGSFTTTDSKITIKITNGIATIVNGGPPATGALEYVLQELSAEMKLARSMVAYEHQGSTYLLHGDGRPGLSESDMVVKLVDVTGVTDLADITTFRPMLFDVTLAGAPGSQTIDFGGTLTGNIWIKNHGAYLSFTRDGYTAAASPALADLATGGIPALSGDEKLQATLHDFSSFIGKLANNVSLKVIAGSSATFSALRELDDATTGLVDATAIWEVSGQVADALHVLVARKGTAGDAISMSGKMLVTLTDIGSSAEIDPILNATASVVTTSKLRSGTYDNFSEGDRINTGLQFASKTAQTLANDTELQWNWDAGTHTLEYETKADSSENTRVVLTGINSITVETSGTFILWA